MADRDLTINLNLLKTAAETASKQYHADEKKRIDKTLSDHDIAEKAKTAIIARENKQKIQAIVAAHKTEIDLQKERAVAAKAADQVIKDALRQSAVDAKRLQKEAVADALKAAKDRKAAELQVAASRRQAAADEKQWIRELAQEAAAKQREERAGNQAINAALRQNAAEEKRIKREQAAEETRLLRDLARQHKQNFKDRQKEKRDQAAETKRLLKEESGAWNENEQAILSGVKAVGGFALGMAGLSSVSSVVNEIEGSFQRARDAIFASTEMLQEYREGLLELAAQKDHAGDTSTEMLQTLKLQAKTGQKFEDAKALQLSFLGTAESVIGPGKKISDKQGADVMEGVGKLAAIMGGGADQWGRMAGMVAQVAKPGTNIAEETAAMQLISRPAQFPTIDAAAEQFSKVQGLVENGVLDARTGMALVSNAGAVKPASAGQDVNRLIRMAMSGTTKDTMGRVMPMEGIDQTSMAAWNKKLNINEKMSPMERLNLMAADFDRAQAESTAKGQGFNPFAYGRTVGITGKGELDTLTDFRASRTSGRLKAFTDLSGDANLGKGAIADANQKLNTGVVFQQRRADTTAQIAKLSQGAGIPEALKPFLTSAYARMSAKDPSMASLQTLQTRGGISGFLGNLYDETRGSGLGDVRANLEQTVMASARAQKIPFNLAAGSNIHMDNAELLRVSTMLQSRGVDLIGSANQEVIGGLESKMQSVGQLGGGGNGAAALNNAANKIGAAADKFGAAVNAKRPPVIPGAPQPKPAAPPGQ